MTMKAVKTGQKKSVIVTEKFIVKKPFEVYCPKFEVASKNGSILPESMAKKSRKF